MSFSEVVKELEITQRTLELACDYNNEWFAISANLRPDDYVCIKRYGTLEDNISELLNLCYAIAEYEYEHRGWGCDKNKS